MMNLEYPDMRAEVVGAFESLSDREHQQRVWIDHVMPSPGYYDDFSLGIHILFDDIPVCHDPDYWVGRVLYPSEVAPVKKLGALLWEMIQDLGDVPDADYLADQRWPQVVNSAKVVMAAVHASDSTK